MMCDRELNDAVNKILTPFEHYLKIFENNKENQMVIREVFKLLKPYFNNDNIDYGVSEVSIKSLKMVLLDRYPIDEYPEYYI